MGLKASSDKARNDWDSKKGNWKYRRAFAAAATHKERRKERKVKPDELGY